LREYKADKNQEKNKEYYENLYRNFPVENIIYWIQNLEGYLKAVLSTEASWFALYQKNFKEKIKGRKVLEMGCGDCTNAAVMAALGAEVYANDIASHSGEIIKIINSRCQFNHPIKFVEGDFLENKLESAQFDFVIGKAFLHHLSLAVEEKFLKETARLLKNNGEARFYEPAVNSLIMDKIRWIVPVKGRPSKLNKKAFKKWKDNDPHPDRSFSSRHFEKTGFLFFKEIEIIPIGTLERFGKLFPWGDRRNNYKRWALKTESNLPLGLNRKFTKSQLIIYRKPI
jgi:SAM-dependent methyltransferase